MPTRTRPLAMLAASLLATALLSPRLIAREPALEPPVPEGHSLAPELPPPAAAYSGPPPYRSDPLLGWLFRRSAGSVEMQDKAYYPRGYHGNYYFRGWKPDWIYPLPPSPIREWDHAGRMPLPGEMEIVPLESRRPAPWGAAKPTPRLSRLPAATANPAPPRIAP